MLKYSLESKTVDLKRISRIIQNKPGFFLLLIILLAISLVTLKPSLYLIGWDNYSAYFNLPTNIFRTFFATWREYRGIGVPSDSEATDLFRQIFYLILSPFVSESLLDQIFMLVVLFIGVISMYAFAYKIFSDYLNRGGRTADVFAFISSFFYLFNLNTLATFYFPILSYTNRFAFLPLIFLLFYNLIQERKVSKSSYILFVFLALITSGTYITATLIVTITLGLFLFALSQGNLKRFVILITFYLSLQAFWLLPFFNYTIQKSSIIRLAPTFINANETQLNKPKSFYDLKKQLVLYPNFFDTEVSRIVGNNKVKFHTLAESFPKTSYQLAISLFPFLYILGSILIILKAKRNRRFLWIPASIALFLFLSLKEFSPLGFIYNFFNNLTPYFGVLFRFGDTKFHPMIAFAGSLSAAFALVFLFSYFKRAGVIVIALVCVITLFVFKSYLMGYLIGPFMYNKLPSAYVDIANTINSDKTSFRVLHLPVSREDYWKSYSWGMFGSSFLHYLLDKPTIDKTFEPGSRENAQINKKIEDLLTNIQLIPESERQKKALEFSQFLNTVGVKYIIFDDSVRAAVYSRGLLLWGKFNNSDVFQMVSDLTKYGFAKEVKRYDVTIEDYRKWYPLNQKETELLGKNSHSSITLFELSRSTPTISFQSQTEFVDPDLTSLTETDLTSQAKMLVQDKNYPFDFYPFKRSDGLLESSESSLSFSYPSPFSENSQVSFEDSQVSPNDTHYIDVFTNTDNEEIVVTFFLRLTPTINGITNRQKIKEISLPLESIPILQPSETNTKDYISDWGELPNKRLGALRIRVGDSTIPLPAQIGQSPSYVATVAVLGSDIPIELLSYEQNRSLPLQAFYLTENPNCFQDKLKDSSYEFQKKEKELVLTSQSQSSCIVLNLNQFLTGSIDWGELSFRLSGTSEDLDSKYGISYKETSKPNLKKYITSLPKPNLLRVCVRESLNDDCYNLHQLTDITSLKSVIFPLEKSIQKDIDMILLLSLKNTGYQKQSIILNDVTFSSYKSVISDSFVVPSSYGNFSLPESTDKKITITIPKAISPYSFFFDPQKEGLYGYNSVCEKGYRTVRNTDSGLLSFTEDCFNEMFQDSPFSSSNFYLWSLSYNLLSGKYPRILIDDGFYFYANDYVSLNQGYPDVEGFKEFQAPEMWYEGNFEERINRLPQKLSYGYIGPNPSLSDFNRKQLTIHQDSENEGIIAMGGFNFQPLPTKWASMKISNGDTKRNFQLPGEYSFKSILPSLWRVDIKDPKMGSYLLRFNQGYDLQWRAYDTLFGATFGIGNSYKPLRCQGFANCFYIDTGSVENKRLYILYTPERLAILGWIITILASFVFVRILIKKD